jgi:hypothetical protein
MSERSRAALAEAGANALVEALVTGRLEEVHQHYAYLLDRDVTLQNADAAGLLRMSCASLEGLSGAALGRASAEQVIVWRARLCELLEQHPQAENDLQFLLSTTLGLAASARPGPEPPGPSPEPPGPSPEPPSPSPEPPSPSPEPPNDEPPPDSAPIEGEGGGIW